MNCQEVIQQLSNYLDAEIDADLRRRIEEHLKGCRRCQAVFDTTRKTIRLYYDGKLFPLPADVRERLHGALRRKWEEKAR